MKACSTSGCCRASSLTSGAEDAFQLPNIKQNRPSSVRRCVFSIYPGKETKEQFSVTSSSRPRVLHYLPVGQHRDIGSSLWNRQSSLKELQTQELIVACQPDEAPFVPISHWVPEENNDGPVDQSMPRTRSRTRKQEGRTRNRYELNIPGYWMVLVWVQNMSQHR